MSKTLLDITALQKIADNTHLSSFRAVSKEHLSLINRLIRSPKLLKELERQFNLLNAPLLFLKRINLLDMFRSRPATAADAANAATIKINR